MPKAKDLWVCPDCGHRFVRKRMWHSCSHYTSARRFNGATPVVRATFDRFLELIPREGPVEVIPQKTRIAIGDM